MMATKLRELLIIDFKVYYDQIPNGEQRILPWITKNILITTLQIAHGERRERSIIHAKQRREHKANYLT